MQPTKAPRLLACLSYHQCRILQLPAKSAHVILPISQIDCNRLNNINYLMILLFWFRNPDCFFFLCNFQLPGSKPLLALQIKNVSRLVFTNLNSFTIPYVHGYFLKSF